MHNDLTLGLMDKVTTSLGDKLREFNQKTCSAFVTRELEREFNARIRRESKKTTPKNCPPSSASRPVVLQHHSDSHHANLTRSNQQESSITPIESEESPTTESNGNARHLKTLNLNTYKIHSLGDYTNTIRRYGTTDSYSTELVREHHFRSISV